MSALVKNNIVRNVLNFLFLTFGAILAACALETFLIPNTILDGGITGISIIINKLSGFSLGLLVFFLNIPFIYVGFKNLGKKFLLRAIYCMVLFSTSLELFRDWNPFTEDMLLATVYGGLLLGIGVGMVIRFGGCVDGTESVAIVISKKTNFSVGQIVMCFNLIIYSVAGFIFGFDRALYSLLTYFITFKVIDFVSEGLEQAKAALIVTSKGTHLSDEIYKRLGRTTTMIKGKGLISGEKEVMYCVLTRVEIFELKRLVEEMDGSAFVTILEVSDIIGNHIKSTNKIKKLDRKGDIL